MKYSIRISGYGSEITIGSVSEEEKAILSNPEKDLQELVFEDLEEVCGWSEIDDQFHCFGATSPFTITSLSGRTAYSVTIKARNSVGLSTASSSLSATTTDSSLDANEAAAAEAARVTAAAAEVARVAAANAEAARKAKEQKELTEILAIIPKIAELTLGLGETTKSLYSTKCVKGKKTKYVKYGAKCPKGYKKK
jgi:hypothetical protein